MAIQYFQPEVWAAQLLSTLEKATVFAGAPIVNRNYEGEIAQYGDTVRITGIADPNIIAYTKDTDLSALQALTDNQQSLVIDQSWAFNFQVDDIDARQVRDGGALMSEAARKAAYGLRDKADQYVAGKLASAAGNGLGVVDASAAATAVYDSVIVPMSVKLDEANMPTEGRWLAVSPATHAKLLLDSRFIKANESGTMAGLRNGIVGEAGGFTIVKSNNMPTRARTGISATVATTARTVTSTVAGTFSQADVGLTITGTNIDSGATIASVSTDGTVATMSKAGTAAGAATDIEIAANGIVALAGVNIAATYAEQISKVEAYRPEARFADALKGLHLYGAKVLRPAGLVAASVKLA